MSIRAVAFDLGETLVDETRYWGAWADRLGVPHLTLFALLGAAIARGEHHRSVLERFGVRNLDDEAAPTFSSHDLYSDARPVLTALHEGGAKTAVAGNFSERIAASVRSWELDVDAVISTDALGAEKPDGRFFLGLAERLEVRPPELLYVGDRVDNDATAAVAAGCRSVQVRRGPWAFIQSPAGAGAADLWSAVGSAVDISRFPGGNDGRM